MSNLRFAKSLRFRFLLVLLLFLTLSFLIAGWLSVTTAAKAMDSALDVKFESTTNALNNLLGAMEKSAKMIGDRMAKDKAFAKAVQNNNHGLIKEKLKDLRETHGTNMLFLLDRKGEVIEGVRDTPNVKSFELHRLDRQIGYNALAEIDNKLYLIKSTPVSNKQNTQPPPGILLVGFPINTKLLRQIKGDSELDISIINDHNLVASTVAQSDLEQRNTQVGKKIYEQLIKNTNKTISASIFNTPYLNSLRSFTSIAPSTNHYILLSYPQALYKDSIDQIYHQIGQFIIAGSIIALTLVLWLSRGFLHSIKILSTGAEKISKGDFRTRILINTGDELQILADTFNKMANTVESTNKALSRYSCDLEREVEVRTRDYRKEERAHAASERKLKSIIDNIVVGLLTTDESGAIETFNPAAEKMFGYQADEVIGQNVSMLIPSPHSENHDKYISEYIDHGDSRIVDRKLEAVGKRSDGSVFPNLLSISEMYLPHQSSNSEEGTIRRHFIATMQDLTETKRTEEILRRTQKMKALGQLTGGIAHDFNNLLGIVIGNLDLLEEELANSDASIKNQLDSALKASLRGSDLTKRLLAFSRTSTTDTSPLNINEVIAGMHNMIEKSLTSSICVEANLSNNLWYTNINPGELEDAIINLAVNSRDAMPDGGRFIIETKNVVTDDTFIDIHPDIKPGEYVLLTVSDTGEGIPESVKDRIFEPFFTTKPTGKGTGLGIPMIYGFIKRSKGHIVLYSEPETGTTFKIFFPRTPSGTTRINDNDLDIDLKLEGQETILIVDDEMDLAGIAGKTLDKLGYKHFIASNADEALGILKNNKNIDLVFSDVVMPGGMDGYALADEVNRLYPEIKILLASGFTNKFHNHQNNNIGYTFLSKPYRRNEMVKSIRELLDSRI